MHGDLARVEEMHAVFQVHPVIERGGRTQTQLIDDLLDTARIISGKLRLEVGPVSLAQVIEDAIQTIYPAATEEPTLLARSATDLGRSFS